MFIRQLCCFIFFPLSWSSYYFQPERQRVCRILRRVWSTVLVKLFRNFAQSNKPKNTLNGSCVLNFYYDCVLFDAIEWDWPCVASVPNAHRFDFGLIGTNRLALAPYRIQGPLSFQTWPDALQRPLCQHQWQNRFRLKRKMEFRIVCHRLKLNGIQNGNIEYISIRLWSATVFSIPLH